MQNWFFVYSNLCTAMSMIASLTPPKKKVAFAQSQLGNTFLVLKNAIT